MPIEIIGNMQLSANKNIMVGILLVGLRPKTLVKSPYVKR